MQEVPHEELREQWNLKENAQAANSCIIQDQR
jgi:hypothetical protein